MSRRLPPSRGAWASAVLVALLGVAPPATRAAEPAALDIPAQPVAQALLEFSATAGVEVLFSYDQLPAMHSRPVSGSRSLPAAEVLARMLEGTGLVAHRHGRDRFIIRPAGPAPGSIRGRMLDATGDPVAGVPVIVIGTRLATASDEAGEFVLPTVPPGRYQLVVNPDGYRPFRIDNVLVEPGLASRLETQRLQRHLEEVSLDPYVVEGRSTRLRPLDDSAALLGPRRATGNLDLPRSENDALPFTIYTREQITRSGVIALNDFLQRVILESDAAARPPEQSGTFNLSDGLTGSSNLRLRGYDENETVILINGRRLPEVQTSATRTLPPDVNFVPLSLIQQVEVLPASASALYSGNPVGGVINIVLRPDVTATEVTTTYTNAVGSDDAPQSSVSFQHGQSLLDGALRLRLNAVLSRSIPATEHELGLRRAHDATRTLAEDRLYRATPNVRAIDPTSPGLFGPGSSRFTSVAPGADGTGGLAAFAGRAGVRNLDFFDAPGGTAASLTSRDSLYGRRQERATAFASATYDPFPWLQLGLDATHSRTVLNQGLDVLAANLRLDAASPHNPFGQEVEVTLSETAPQLGEDYSEARIHFTSAVAGVLLRLPSEWRLSLDAQGARNLVKFRGLAGADEERWQELVNQGVYRPLRDTQVHAPPRQFHDRVLVFRGGPGRFVTLGDYTTVDAAARLSNQSLRLPTGKGAIVAGADYRLLHLDDYREEAVYADGTPAGTPAVRAGRTLERYSFFSEVRGPVLPPRLHPRWLRGLEADIAVRYVASSNANEVNTAPTFGLKADFAGGFAVRGSVTTSNRFPTPQLHREVSAPGGPGGGLNLELVYDPRRDEFYDVAVHEAIDPGLPPEEAVTQTAGILWERGRDHRLRATLDFVDTRKTSEILALAAKDLVNVEAVFPGRVERGPTDPADPSGVGRITRLVTGSVNASWRRSQNWTAALEYAWSGCLGGTLEARARLLHYVRYERQLFANSPVVDQLADPDGTAPGLLRYRADFGAGWSGRRYGFGVDGQYFHSRILPLLERPSQGADRIRPYWQFDAWLQADLTRLLPGDNPRHGLRAQLRVNNLSGFDYPRYVNDGAGAGVQPYGDWRGRTYSVSVTAVF